MNIARFSVSRPVAVTMRIAALVLLGIISFLRLPVDLLPKVDIPTVAISVSWPNTAPEEMEAQITRPIEQAVATVPGLYNVSSTSSLGSSFVRVQLNYGVDVNAAASDVSQYVQRAKRSFPSDPNIQEPTVFKFDPSTQPIVVYGVTGENDPVKLNTLLTNEVSPIIEGAGGVAQVTVSGGAPRAILVEADPAKLEAFGLGLADLTARIRAENLSLPAGIARAGDTEYTLRATGYFRSVAELANLPLRATNGRVVLLKEVANVRDASPEVRTSIRLNELPAVGLSVSKQASANTIETTQSVRAKVAEVERRYPNLKFTVAYEQAEFVQSSVDELKQTAIVGGVLAILVITFFLRNARSTLVVALSIPISIVSTFSLLYFGGFTLNTISLSGLALATGLIVDDAIVVLENIFRHLERDRSNPYEAAVAGTKEIMSAVVASTGTVMIVFVPLLLIKGQSGQTFTQFALVVIFSLAVSLLDAATVVPMLASRMLRRQEILALEHPEERGRPARGLERFFDRIGRSLNRLDAAYHRGLAWALRRRWVVMAGAALSVVAVFPLVPLVGSETLPQTDSGDFSVRARFPVGTAYDVTSRKMLEVEKVLRADPEIETVFLAAGTNVSPRGIGGGGSSNVGSALVRLRRDRKSRTEDVIKRLNPKFSAIAGARVTATPYDLVANALGGQNEGIEVDVFGADLDAINAQAKVVADALRDVPGLEGADVGTEDASPEIGWRVDRTKALLLGVSYADVASAIGVATSGALTTYYQEGGFQYPIYVQLPIESRRSIEAIRQIPVKLAAAAPGTPPATIRLGQLATATPGTGPNAISRINRRRFVAINGRVVDRSSSAVEAEVRAKLERTEFAPGTSWDFGDRQQRRAQEFSGLGLSVFLAIALIYILLASQFESFVYPLIVLASVPLCVVGAVLALFLSGKAFGLTAYVGVLMLIGIVVKNGILLVDYTNTVRATGKGRDEAILIASPTRLRPILMTSLAAMLGMLPLALGIGASSELQAPLAVVVVGGLLTSTVLTLFVVPVVYTLFDDLARRFRRDPRDLAAGPFGPGGTEEPVVPGTELAPDSEEARR